MLVKFVLLVSLVFIFSGEVKCEENSLGKDLFSDELVEEGRTFAHRTLKRLAIILPAIFFKLGISFTLLLLVTIVAVNNGFIGFLLLIVGMSTVLARLQEARKPALPVPLSYAPLPPIAAHYSRLGRHHYNLWDRNDDVTGTPEVRTPYTEITNSAYQTLVSPTSIPYIYTNGDSGTSYVIDDNLSNTLDAITRKSSHVHVDSVASYSEQGGNINNNITARNSRKHSLESKEFIKFVDLMETPQLGGDGRGNKGSKGEGFLQKILPFMVLPFIISSSIIPIALTILKFMLLKSAFIGKIAIILLLINMFLRFNRGGGVYSHNLNLTSLEKDIALSHYGYNGDEEYGAYINHSKRR
ncbi:hypothetical protein Trydic_g6947 [Trypoxylus dichotomus]